MEGRLLLEGGKLLLVEGMPLFVASRLLHVKGMPLFVEGSLLLVEGSRLLGESSLGLGLSSWEAEKTLGLLEGREGSQCHPYSFLILVAYPVSLQNCTSSGSEVTLSTLILVPHLVSLQNCTISGSRVTLSTLLGPDTGAPQLHAASDSFAITENRLPSSN